MKDFEEIEGDSLTMNVATVIDFKDRESCELLQRLNISSAA